MISFPRSTEAMRPPLKRDNLGQYQAGENLVAAGSTREAVRG